MDHVSLIPVTDLKRWERNPRLHPDANIAALCGSLRQFGLARLPVLATWPGQSEGCIIAGNGITTALMRMYEADPAHPPQGVDGGEPWMIPVRPRVFDSQPAAEAYGLVDNWSTEASEDDPLLVAPILQELQDVGWDMGTLFAEPDDLAELLNPPVPTEEVETEGDAEDVDGPPDSVLGGVYELGPHRLVCGDSRDAQAWAKLLPDGEKLQMVWTDPPYGVAIAGGSHTMNSKDRAKHGGKVIENDNLPRDEFEKFLRATLGNAALNCEPGSAWYVATSPGPTSARFSVVLEEMDIWRHTLVWVKQRFVFGHADYHYRFESIFYGWVPGATHYFVDERTHDNVLEFDRPSKSEDHPTMKPVELVEFCINNSSKPAWIVGEPFGGSGTTLIACAKTGRKARLIEIDPRYCDVIRRRWTRWAKEAGKDPGPGALV